MFACRHWSIIDSDPSCTGWFVSWLVGSCDNSRWIWPWTWRNATRDWFQSSGRWWQEPAVTLTDAAPRFFIWEDLPNHDFYVMQPASQLEAPGESRGAHPVILGLLTNHHWWLLGDRTACQLMNMMSKWSLYCDTYGWPLHSTCWYLGWLVCFTNMCHRGCNH